MPAFSASEAFKGNIYNQGQLKPVDSTLKVKVGDPAPDFTLPSVSGEKISLSHGGLDAGLLRSMAGL
jgi:peroxiredoxin (alkyl hydroperoxide reductase subunit C)